MKYWLMKSEPGEFSIDDLARRPRRREPWDGVRNYQVRNMIRDEMRRGDLALFYHSSCEVPGVAGVVEIASEARPDPTAFDPADPHYDPRSDPDNPRWYLVDVRLVRKLARLIPLRELKQHRALAGMPLLRRGNRLSIVPLTRKQWDYIVALEKAPG